MKKTHYHTSENTILCQHGHKKTILAIGRFSYKYGEKGNCKNCDRVLSMHENTSNFKCESFNKLGYKTECQWRNKTKCNCIDGCAFKVFNG
jgi:hypothetical protein